MEKIMKKLFANSFQWEKVLDYFWLNKFSILTDQGRHLIATNDYIILHKIFIRLVSEFWAIKFEQMEITHYFLLFRFQRVVYTRDQNESDFEVKRKRKFQRNSMLLHSTHMSS